jgi:hypothetical protein
MSWADDLAITYVIWNNGIIQSPMPYWLKSFNTKPAPVPGVTYSVSEINQRESRVSTGHMSSLTSSPFTWDGHPYCVSIDWCLDFGRPLERSQMARHLLWCCGHVNQWDRHESDAIVQQYKRSLCSLLALQYGCESACMPELRRR